jgi:hypothetical protein
MLSASPADPNHSRRAEDGDRRACRRGQQDDRGRARADHRGGVEAAQRSPPMTPPKRTYDFRIVGWQVFTPEEQERIYMPPLTSQSVEVSHAMRKLILEEWPELAHKLAPKRAPE